MVRKNGRLLSEVLDDSFVLIHMTGMRQSKEVFIRSVEDGTLNYYSTAHQEIKTEIHGETAALHGKSIVSYTYMYFWAVLAWAMATCS